MKIQITKLPKNIKAIGGVLQSHGSDWGSGLINIGAGGSHEENPNEGIQMGVDPQGTPNLVEENETVYNDYVYSNRIFADGGTLKKFHLPKKAKLTYADISKKLEKEIKERPNDPISKAAFKAQMEDLANEQERQKQEVEAERAREAFEALSPEEQVEVMQYAQQQEQAQQEAAMQEQAMVEQQAAAQQPSPEEMAMMQQQMQGQPMIGEGYAYGGNLFALGGDDDNILIRRPAGYSFGYTPSNGVVPASAAYKRAAEVRTENRQAAPKTFKGKPLPRRKGMADSSYAKEMEKAGFNDLEIDEYILGADGNNRSLTYSPRTKTFKAKKWRKSSGEPLYSKAEIDAEQKSFASGAKRANSAKVNQSQTATKQAAKSTSTTNKPVQTAKAQVQNVTTASSKPVYGTSKSGLHTKTVDGVTQYRGADGNYYYDENKALATRTPRASVFSSASNAVERAYADAQAKAQAKAQAAPATSTSTTTNPDPFGAEARAIKFQDLRNSSKATASESSAVEEAPVVEATPRRAVTPSNTDTQADRGTERNVGDWKNPDENHWDLYTKPGFESYIDNAIARYNMAGSDEDKRAIQDEVMNAVNGLQQSYNDVIAPIMGASKYSYSPEVKAHQTKFENLGGNRGFWPTQEDGSIVNAIGNAINLPLGYSTGDNPSGRGIDGYNGRQTEQRHFGSTADGDATYFAPLVDKIKSGLNLNYSPNASWSYGKDGQYQLYGLSRIEAPVADNSASSTGPLNAPAAPDANGNTSVPGRYGNMPWAPENAKPTDKGTPAVTPVATPAATTPASTPTTDEYDVVPVLKDEKLRYAGLAAPIVGLGMQMAGIGKPDKSGLDYYLDLYNKHGAAMADYMPIGDYHRYTPMDVWASLNRMDANARAADRIMMNSSLPLTTKYALTMGNNYTNQIAHGETYRQGLEYNDNKSLQAAQFNKDTNKFNAEAYNRAALQNAEAMNRQRQYSAQLGMQAAAQKADMDAGWYNGIYGNVAGLFKGISDLGKENAQHNMIAKMAADGIFGNISDKQFTGQGFLKRVPKYTASEGGKIGKKKGKRGLTI